MSLLPALPPPGCKRGATPDVLPNNWFDMNLVRFRGGQLIPIGGYVVLENTMVDSPPRDLITWHGNMTGRWCAFGTDNHLYAYRFDTGQLYNITPASVGPLDPPGAILGWGIGDYGAETYGTARDPSNVAAVDASGTMGDWWSLALFGQDLMVVPTQHGGLFRWSPDTPSTPAALVAGAPVQNRGVLVTDERHVVLIGAGGVMRSVVWCSQENPTDWVPSTTNTAGDLMLETEGRPLMARRVIGGANLIWTDNDVHELKFVGPPWYFGLRKLASNCGLIAPRAASFCGPQVLWMSVQGFHAYEGGTVSPVGCDVQDWLFSLINRQMIGRIYGYGNAEFREHWFHWPDEGATEDNRYVCVNYAEPSHPWAIGQLACTAGDNLGAMIRPICGMAMDGGGCLIMHEFGWTSNGASRVGEIYAETGNLDLGNGDKRFHVTQIEHDFAGAPQQLAYRFFCRERAAGEERQAGPYPITRTDGLVDVRFSARRARMRIEAVEDGPWALGMTRLNVVPAGTR